MAHIMTKKGNMDNVITYEHFCDTLEDREDIDPEYITLGSVCIIVGEDDAPIDIYISNSKKQWKLFQ